MNHGMPVCPFCRTPGQQCICEECKGDGLSLVVCASCAPKQLREYHTFAEAVEALRAKAPVTT